MTEYKATQIGEMVFGKLKVPVRKIDGENQYKGQVVCESDLPQDLAEAFSQWMTCAQIPAPGYAYVHDFVDFVRRGGRGRSGDWSKVVERNL